MRRCYYDSVLDEVQHRALAYSSDGAIVDGGRVCSGPVEFVAHDKRRCVLVCQAHGMWREKTSRLVGHSEDCPHMEAREDEHISRLPPESNLGKEPS